MSRTFLVTFNGPPEMRDLFTNYLDSRDEVTDWHSSMINSVFVSTNLDAVELRELLRTSPVRRFIAVEIMGEDFNRRVSGWLPRATWDFLKRRQPAKKARE